MKWYFINTGFNTGKFNMDFDLHLSRICKEGEAYFRLYRWQPYCISLGANQDINNINIKKAENDNIDIVKRPTGGRAILHSEEITYSVIYPLAGTSPKTIYNEINSALIAGLKLYNEKLADAELENMQPDFPAFYKDEISAVCFAASAKSEVKFSGKKIIGSAQRKLNQVVLQHGSILCGDYHTRITEYLNISDEGSERIINQMLNKTTDIKSVLGEDVNYERLAGALRQGFEKFYNVTFEQTIPEEILSYTGETSLIN